MTDLRTPTVEDGDLFSERAREYAIEKPLQRIHILEAGCGWGTGLNLADQDLQVTGVDADTPELRARTRERRDLAAWYLGDLRTVPLPPRAYDIVHAPYLIERVAHAELVLDRFVAALKPGGLLLVRLRDRNTAFGFLDRHLPRWTHASGRPRGRRGRGAHARLPYPAGADPAPAAGAEPAAEGADGAVVSMVDGHAHGTGPASPTSLAAPVPAAEGAPRRGRLHRRDEHPPPAVYDRVASLAGMRWYCVMRGLVITEEYTSRRAVAALGAGTGLADLACRLVAALSRGRLPADHSEVSLVIRKPENRFARVI